MPYNEFFNFFLQFQVFTEHLEHPEYLPLVYYINLSWDELITEA